MSKIKLGDLTPEAKKQLLDELVAEERNKQEIRKKEIENYNHLKDDTITRVFSRLQYLSSEIEVAKKELLDEFEALVKLKNELYGVEESQQSHTWTLNDGSISIITGFNAKDRWDDSVSVGISKVNTWLDKQINDSNRNFALMIRELLKPNKDGILKANRVLDLQNHADKTEDLELIEAVRIIRDAYRPDRTRDYIKAKFKDSDGAIVWVPLSMSQA